MLSALKGLLVKSDPPLAYVGLVKGVSESVDPMKPHAVYTLQIFNKETGLAGARRDIVTAAPLSPEEHVTIKYQRRRILGIPISSEKILKGGKEFDLYDAAFVAIVSGLNERKYL